MTNGSTIAAGETITINPGTLDTGEAVGADGNFVMWDFSNSGGYVEWTGNTIGNWNWIFGTGTIGFTFTNTSGEPLTLSFLSGNTGTITETGGAAATTGGSGGSGPTTDYALNPWINNPSSGSVTAANTKVALTGISDGTSNTILLGHAYLALTDYPLTTPTTTLAPIFSGGTLGTAALRSWRHSDDLADRWGCSNLQSMGQPDEKRRVDGHGGRLGSLLPLLHGADRLPQTQ